MQTYIICIQTLCGKITPAGFGSKLDRRHLERWRERTDATLFGAGSLRDGDPEFRDTSGNIPPNRIRAIVTMSGNLPKERKIFHKGPKPFIFTTQSVAARLSAALGDGAQIFPIKKLGPGELDLGQVLKTLESFGAEKVLIEGGGRLNYLAIKQGVVDQLLITIAPKLLCTNHETPLVAGDRELGDPFIHLELLSSKVEPSSGELFLKYKIIKKEKTSG